MGTKNNPGKFDCYANAEPDEPMFILLARDPLAPILVQLWADLCIQSSVESEASQKSAEAAELADHMISWRQKHRPGKRLVVLPKQADRKSPPDIRTCECNHAACSNSNDHLLGECENSAAHTLNANAGAGKGTVICAECAEMYPPNWIE